MTPAQQSELLTILHLHHVTHGQDVSELIERVKMTPVTRPDELTDIDTLAVNTRKRIRKVRLRHQHLPKEIGERKVMELIAAQGIPQHPMEDIINAVTSVCGISSELICSPQRDRPIMDARHLSVGLTYIYCLHMVLTAIGGKFNRHHAAVLHEFRMMGELSKYDAVFADKRRKVEAILNNSKA
jgi:chromosomal replication initiation ATPase DnaA